MRQGTFSDLTVNNYMNKDQLQQGDVLLRRVTEIPSTFKRVKATKRGYVLAEGETTGHAHTIEESEDIELYQEGERLLAQVLKSVTVTHEEHGPITLDAGIWEIGRVVEEDEFGEMQQVKD